MRSITWKTGIVVILSAFLLTGCADDKESQKQNDAQQDVNKENAQQTENSGTVVNPEEEVLTAVLLLSNTGEELFVDIENDNPFFGTIPDDILDENGDVIPADKMNSGDVYLVYGNQVMTRSYPAQYPGIEKLVRQESANQEYIEKYQQLLEQFCPEPDTTQPPELSVDYRQPDALVTAAVNRGGYQWTVQKEDGESESVIADSAHVLDWGELLTEIQLMEETEMELVFTYNPQNVEVKRWPEKERKELRSLDVFSEGEVVEIEENEEGFTFRGEPGYVYQITGTWEEGTVEYGFCSISR
ncbi:hypothetical protein MR857_09380 [bacterium]|nr:hypothetical protein [bacterium]MDY3023136.1 hypothetical protein [Oliverpabstia sp.]